MAYGNELYQSHPHELFTQVWAHTLVPSAERHEATTLAPTWDPSHLLTPMDPH